jgi:hypothetical protein
VIARATACLADLDRADLLLEPSDLSARFEDNYVRCDALLALAKANSLRHQDQEALRLYRRAEDLLQALSHHPEDMAQAYEKLCLKVKEQVRQEVPRLNQLSSRSTPSS